MASPIITPLPVQTDTDYKPLSKLAVIGFLVSLASPFIFASENLFWMLLIPILPAFILCFIALRAIRSSEGNLAGEAVALLGLVIAVGSGLGWLTMTLTTKFITEREARAAADDWLQKLQKGEFGAAYLMTKPPSARKINFNPEELNRLRKLFPHNQYASDFDNFLIEPLSGLFLRYGEKAKFTYGGLLEAKTVSGVAIYRFRYDIDTPAATGSCIVVANSENDMDDEGIRRDYVVRFDNNNILLQDTAYGGELTFMRNKAEDQAQRLGFAIANDEGEVIQNMMDAKRLGDFSMVLGFARPPDIRGEILDIKIQRPMRLMSDKKENNRWSLTFDCTLFIADSRGIDFTVTAESQDEKGNQWLFHDVRFRGLRKIGTNNPDAVMSIQSGPASNKPER
ncbi:MAG TPA: hypothetical protein PKD72_14140 [Gemmatales bacterium]|nr:hypothetical protein [Gemmatales bacterium]